MTLVEVYSVWCYLLTTFTRRSSNKLRLYIFFNVLILDIVCFIVKFHYAFIKVNMIFTGNKWLENHFWKVTETVARLVLSKQYNVESKKTPEWQNKIWFSIMLLGSKWHRICQGFCKTCSITQGLSVTLFFLSCLSDKPIERITII